MLSLPAGYAADPGLEILARLETERAGYEFPTRAFLDCHLAPGDVFIDVGAHLGVYSLGAATLHPAPSEAVRVVAFEPHPLNILTLLRQLALNGRQHDVEVVCSACGAAPGLAQLWPFSTMGNYIAAERPKDAAGDNPPLTVPVTPLDTLLNDRPDLAGGRVFVKIDVEGYEPEVVAGAEGLLASGRVDALVIEKSDHHAAPERRRAYEAMIETLRGHDFDIRWFPHVHLPCALIPWVSGNETGNLVAVGPSLKPRAAYDGPYAPYTPLPPPMNADFGPDDRGDLTRRLIEQRGTDGWRWANPQSLESGAEARMTLALPHIPPNASVLDLGAGIMAVLSRLSMSTRYTPVDLVRYSKATVLCDLNDGQFPEGTWDCALALALLEHIHDIPALLRRIRNAAKRLIVTYETVETLSDAAERRQRGYFNDYDSATLRAIFEATGWQVTRLEGHGAETLFVCT